MAEFILASDSNGCHQEVGACGMKIFSTDSAAILLTSLSESAILYWTGSFRKADCEPLEPRPSGKDGILNAPEVPVFFVFDISSSIGIKL